MLQGFKWIAKTKAYLDTWYLQILFPAFGVKKMAQKYLFYEDKKKKQQDLVGVSSKGQIRGVLGHNFNPGPILPILNVDNIVLAQNPEVYILQEN